MPNAPEALKEDLLGVVKVTENYDAELEAASKIALRTINNQIDSINSVDGIEASVKSADKQFADPQILEAACIVVQKALDEAIRGRDEILACSNALKTDITPDHPLLVESVQRVTTVVQKPETQEFTDEKMKSAANELKGLREAIEKAIHADEERVESAGNAFRMCIFKRAYSADIILATYNGNLQIIINGLPKA